MPALRIGLLARRDQSCLRCRLGSVVMDRRQIAYLLIALIAVAAAAAIAWKLYHSRERVLKRQRRAVRTRRERSPGRTDESA